MKNTIQH